MHGEQFTYKPQVIIPYNININDYNLEKQWDCLTQIFF
jgi:hypothetical protein